MQERCQRKEQESLMSRREKNAMSDKGRTNFGIQQIFGTGKLTDMATNFYTAQSSGVFPILKLVLS